MSDEAKISNEEIGRLVTKLKQLLLVADKHWVFPEDLEQIVASDESVRTFLDAKYAVGLFKAASAPIRIAYAPDCKEQRSIIVKLAQFEKIASLLSCAKEFGAPEEIFYSPEWAGPRAGLIKLAGSDLEALFTDELKDSVAAANDEDKGLFFARFNIYSDEMTRSGIPFKRFIDMSAGEFLVTIKPFLDAKVDTTLLVQKGGAKLKIEPE